VSEYFRLLTSPQVVVHKLTSLWTGVSTILWLITVY